jgi:hypothetical protein
MAPTEEIVARDDDSVADDAPQDFDTSFEMRRRPRSTPTLRAASTPDSPSTR